MHFRILPFDADIESLRKLAVEDPDAGFRVMTRWLKSDLEPQIERAVLAHRQLWNSTRDLVERTILEGERRLATVDVESKATMAQADREQRAFEQTASRLQQETDPTRRSALLGKARWQNATLARRGAQLGAYAAAYDSEIQSAESILDALNGQWPKFKRLRHAGIRLRLRLFTFELLARIPKGAGVVLSFGTTLLLDSATTRTEPYLRSHAQEFHIAMLLGAFVVQVALFDRISSKIRGRITRQIQGSARKRLRALWIETHRAEAVIAKYDEALRSALGFVSR